MMFLILMMLIFPPSTLDVRLFRFFVATSVFFIHFSVITDFDEFSDFNCDTNIDAFDTITAYYFLLIKLFVYFFLLLLSVCYFSFLIYRCTTPAFWWFSLFLCCHLYYLLADADYVSDFPFSAWSIYSIQFLLLFVCYFRSDLYVVSDFFPFASLLFFIDFAVLI